MAPQNRPLLWAITALLLPSVTLLLTGCEQEEEDSTGGEIRASTTDNDGGTTLGAGSPDGSGDSPDGVGDSPSGSVMELLPACNGTQALTTMSMTTSDYDAIVAAVRSQYEALPTDCTATFCPQADWTGCILRLAGHDFMDYSSGQGGSDGCLDMSDPDNVGLAECLYRGEFEQSIAQSYSSFCTQISLADFIVVAAEAVMTLTRERVTQEDATRQSMDFKSQFKFGRTTSTNCASSAGLMPNPERSCTAVDEVFRGRLGLTWRQSAALMGVHTLGRAHPSNSGYDGFWSDAENSRRFNNDYYVSLLLKGWGPETAVMGNPLKNQWERIDDGVNTQRLGKEMMLNTDLCLAFSMDENGNVELDAASAERNSCECTWVELRLVDDAQTKYNGGEFCGSTRTNAGRDECCGNGVRRGDDCGRPDNPRGPAASDVVEFANDEEAWIEVFLDAWGLATSGGFSLSPLQN